MVWGNAILPDGCSVLLRGITLVRQPVILRILLSQLIHIVVAIGLGKDRGSGYREILAITLDDSGMGDGNGGWRATL